MVHSLINVRAAGKLCDRSLTCAIPERLRDDQFAIKASFTFIFGLAHSVPCAKRRCIICCEMCQVMESTGRCVAVSQPASPNVVGLKYRKFGDSPEIRQLTRDVVRWECRPYPTIQPPPLAYVLKIDAPTVTALPIFRQRRLFLSSFGKTYAT